MTRTAEIRKRRLSALAVTAIAALGGLAIAGCGGGDNGSTTTGAAGGSEAQGVASTVSVSETEYKLDPSDPTAKAGTVTFEVSNDGQVTHSLEVEGPSGDEELAKDLAPGESGTLSVDLSKPGTYEFYCPIDGHKDRGMEGEVTVSGSGDGSGSSASSSSQDQGTDGSGGGYSY